MCANEPVECASFRVKKISPFSSCVAQLSVEAFAMAIFQREMAGLIAEIHLNPDLDRMIVTLLDGVSIRIQFNDHDEYSYSIFFSSVKNDFCRFDNYDEVMDNYRDIILKGVKKDVAEKIAFKNAWKLMTGEDSIRSRGHLTADSLRVP
jgi:hypothetical protein